VVRVWFCNRRQKEKRMLSGALSAMAAAAAGPGGLLVAGGGCGGPGSAASSSGDLPGDDAASPASPTSSGGADDDATCASAASAPGRQQPLLYPPSLADYCSSVPLPARRGGGADYAALDSFCAHAPPPLPHVPEVTSYASGGGDAWLGSSPFRAHPQLTSLMAAAAAAGAIMPTDSAHSLAI